MRIGVHPLNVPVDDIKARKLFGKVMRENGVRPVHVNLFETAAILRDKWELIYNGKNLLDLDGFIYYSSINFPYMERAEEKRQHILRILSIIHEAMPMINSHSSILDATDKFRASILLAKAKIPTPETILAYNYETVRDFLEKHKAIVLKPFFGYGGKGILLIKDKMMLRDILTNLKSYQTYFYVQKYIPNPGQDLRVIVAGDKALHCVKRKGKDSWKSNITYGGIAKKEKLTDDITKLAIGAAKALNLDYAGIDIIMSKGRKYVIEVNNAPMFWYESDFEKRDKKVWKELTTEMIRALCNLLKNEQKQWK